MAFNSTIYEPNLQDTTACNNRNSPFNYVAGDVSRTSYQMRLVSDSKTRIVNAAFAQIIQPNFPQAYDPRLTKGSYPSGVGFIDNYSSNNLYTVRQLNKDGTVTGVGKTVRWVPSTEVDSEASLFIQVTSANSFISPYVGTTYNATSALDSGIIFSEQYTSDAELVSTGWGSSVKSIENVNEVWEFTLTTDTTHTGGTIDATGVLTAINLKNAVGTQLSQGYIFRTETQSGLPIVTVHLFTNISNVDQGFILQSQQLTDGLPCFSYLINSSQELTSLGFVRIEFNDRNESKLPFNNSAIETTTRNIYQWRWDTLTGNSAAKAQGVFYAWVPSQKALYVGECDENNTFAVKYGPVYQSGGIVWGNEGFTTNTNFTERSGRFVNIKHNEENNYSDTKEYIQGETLLQTLSRDFSYDTNYNFIPGEKVFQIQEPNTNGDPDSSVNYEYSSATVISWSYPDQTNPADTSPMILVARIDRYGPDQPGAFSSTTNPFAELNDFTVGDTVGVSDFAFAGKIVPYRVLIGSLTGIQSWPYEVNSANVYFTDNRETRAIKSSTPVNSTIGTTRVRAVTPYSSIQEGETGPLYKFFIFDTELTEPDSSFKNVSGLVYKSGDVRKKISTVAPFSGKKRVLQSFGNTNQTIETYDTVVFEPGKDKNIFKLPVGTVFENVMSGDSLSVEIQKVFNTRFENSSSTVTIAPNSGSSPLSNLTFLTADANTNWFVVNTATGEKYTLVTGQAPQANSDQLSYEIQGDSLVLNRAASETAQEDITVFAKMDATFTVDTIKKKRLYSQTKTVTSLALQTTGKHKGKYTAIIDADGIVAKLNSIYAVTSTGQPITGTAKLDAYFKIDVGVTDQKIVKPQLVLNPGYSNPDGTLKGEVFSTPESSVAPESVFLEVSYDYYGYDTIDVPGIAARESFKDSDGTQSSVADVPFYISPNDGMMYHESSIIDFRPNALQPGNNGFDMGNTKIVPHPDWADSINVSFYLPRRDKLILNARGDFEVLYGTPSLTPTYPQDKLKSMTLYLLDKADYIFNPTDIKYKMLENRRYTMRDIGKIDNRVKKLEYYTTLSLLEKSAEDLLVLDANGNDRFKSGILVDTFTGHRIGDVVNPDYNIAMDFNEGYARPPFRTETTRLISLTNGSTTFVKIGDNGIDSETDRGDYRDNIYMFPYTREVFVAQPLATRSISVQPHEVTVFEGTGNMFPPLDNWVDREFRPALNVNLAGDNDAWQMMVASFNNNNLAPFGTQWNEWQTLSSVGINSESETQTTSEVIAQGNRNRGEFPTGTPDIQIGSANRWLWRDTAITTLTTTTITEQLLQERTGLLNTLSTSTSEVSLGNRIVDVSLQPYMREAILRVWGVGLKPRSKMYVFFDGINVAEYCYKYNSLNDLFQDVAGDIPTPLHFATADISDLKTNDNGAAFIEFRLPGGTFRTGDRKFEITDDPRNDRNKASSYASAIYSASGLRTVSEETIATTRNFEVTRSDLPSEQRTIENTRVETESSTVIQRNNWDPLAQTFFVDPVLYPEGIFLESVDIFFARKPTENVPVHIQVRPVVNGYPDSVRIYPGGIVFKQMDEVNVSDTPNANDSSTITKFAFSRPLHLLPGEHSIVVKSPSSEYEVYIATLGDFLLGTQSKVTNQPYVGVFFTSANASTWTADQNSDIMMILNKCVFTTNQVYDVELQNEQRDDIVVYETINLTGSYVDFASCRTQWEFTGVPITNTTFAPIGIEPNENKQLRLSCSYGKDANKTCRISVSASTTNRDVCPVIDLDVMDLFTVQNLLESNSTVSANGELNPYAASTQQGSIARARYVSRVVTLEDGFESNNLKCVLTLHKPENTNIQVFAKVQETYSTGEFHQNSYVQMTPNITNFDSFYTTNPNEFVEVEFDLPSDTSSSFNRFCIKICMYSTNTAYVPKIKDMRAMAVL